MGILIAMPVFGFGITKRYKDSSSRDHEYGFVLVVCCLFKQFEASCIVLLCSVTVNPPSSASIVFKQSVHFLCDCVARIVFAACFLNSFVFRGSDKRRVKPLEYCPV